MTAGTTISRRMEKVETGAGMGAPPESQYCFALSGSEVSMENRVDYTPFLLNLESDKLGCSECQLDQGFRGNWIDGLPMMLMYLCEIHLLPSFPFRRGHTPEAGRPAGSSSSARLSDHSSSAGFFLDNPDWRLRESAARDLRGCDLPCCGCIVVSQSFKRRP